MALAAALGLAPLSCAIIRKPLCAQLLRIIGKGPAPQGIIEPAALPAAIKAIEETKRFRGRKRKPR